VRAPRCSGSAIAQSECWRPGGPLSVAEPTRRHCTDRRLPETDTRDVGSEEDDEFVPTKAARGGLGSVMSAGVGTPAGGEGDGEEDSVFGSVDGDASDSDDSAKDGPTAARRKRGGGGDGVKRSKALPPSDPGFLAGMCERSVQRPGHGSGRGHSSSASARAGLITSPQRSTEAAITAMLEHARVRLYDITQAPSAHGSGASTLVPPTPRRLHQRDRTSPCSCTPSSAR